MNNDVSPTSFRPKKSVALSGVPAGNTAICTVGRSGNDLHYRGYDIIDLAQKSSFEEVAYLLLYGSLPDKKTLEEYQKKLVSLRGLDPVLKNVLEQIPATAHPMDVLRTYTSVLGTVAPEDNKHSIEGARDIADKLIASSSSALLYWYHFANGKQRIEVETDDATTGAHFLHLLHQTSPSQSWIEAMETSLNLYAEHEFNASTFTARVIAGTGSDIYSCADRNMAEPMK